MPNTTTSPPTHSKSLLLESKIDRTAFSVVSLHDGSDETSYWLSRTVDERLEAIELMRQINYGYNPHTERLQRVFEVARLQTN